MATKIKVRTREKREMTDLTNELYRKWKNREDIRKAKRGVWERYHPLQAALQAVNIYITNQLKK